jgi:hypothetical protein
MVPIEELVSRSQLDWIAVTRWEQPQARFAISLRALALLYFRLTSRSMNRRTRPHLFARMQGWKHQFHKSLPTTQRKRHLRD